MNKKIIIPIASALIVLGFAGLLLYPRYAEKKQLQNWQELAAKHPQGVQLMEEIKRRQVELKDDNAENDIAANNYLAISISNLGDKTGALKYYERALKLDPKSRIALNNIANVYQDLSDWNNAEVYFKKLITAEPGYTPAYRSLAYLYQYRFNDPEEKIKALIDQGLAANPDNGDLLSWIISYYQEKQENDKAVPYSQRLVDSLNKAAATGTQDKNNVGIQVEYK
ncbi:MAG: tetratricopeptide repeat protein [Patescibacteria group bacterium]